ncbi:MAG: hypothetical protein JKY56_25705 [Kofleriaceae bacterium]|nr:hypothetical protein [Kofleriaceae bacterium]
MRVRQLSILIVSLSLTVLGVRPDAATAKSKRGPEILIFQLAQVDIPKNSPPGLEALIRSKFDALMSKQPQLLPQIPKDAPSMDASVTDRRGNKPFRKYMKKHRMRPFRVTLEVKQLEMDIKDNPRVAGKLISAKIQIHMFGETLPFRTMAFTGDGSATIAIEVGKKVRDKDKRFAREDAAEFAINLAIAASLQKLKIAQKK